jgi:hypothetical protein
MIEHVQKRECLARGPFEAWHHLIACSLILPNLSFLTSQRQMAGKMQVQGLVDLPHIHSNHLIHTNTMPEIVCTAPSLEPFPTN